MDVDFTKLPLSIRRQIPLSLRSYKDVHVLEDLPVVIQYLIRNYLEKNFEITYKTVFDIKPIISKYSDFETVDNISDLISDYLKNYLLILPNSYPWDPMFGCQLKYQLQTRDTNLRQTLINTEINNIVNVIAADIGAEINIEEINIIPISTGGNTEYTARVVLKINNDQHKQINMTFYD